MNSYKTYHLYNGSLCIIFFSPFNIEKHNGKRVERPPVMGSVGNTNNL